MIHGGYRMTRTERRTEPSLSSAPICVPRTLGVCDIHQFYVWFLSASLRPTYNPAFYFLLS